MKIGILWAADLASGFGRLLVFRLSRQVLKQLRASFIVAVSRRLLFYQPRQVNQQFEVVRGTVPRFFIYPLEKASGVLLDYVSRFLLQPRESAFCGPAMHCFGRLGTCRSFLV